MEITKLTLGLPLALLLGVFGVINVLDLRQVLDSSAQVATHIPLMDEQAVDKGQHLNRLIVAPAINAAVTLSGFEARIESSEASNDENYTARGDADGEPAVEPHLPLPLILQSTPYNCGLAALAMLLSYTSDSPVSLESLERTAAVLLNKSSQRWLAEGYSVGELQTLARAYGVSIRAGRVTTAELATFKLPLLAWIDIGGNGHFTVVQSWSNQVISLADPTQGYLRLSKTMWERLWLKGATGIVLSTD